MNLKDWAIIPVITAIVLLSIAAIINDANIEDTGVSGFLDSANDFEDANNNLYDTFDEKTETGALGDFVESTPLLGDLVKTGRFVTGIVGAIKTSFAVFVGFFRDTMSSNVLGVPSGVVVMVMSLVMISFGFAVLNSMKGKEDN